MGSEPSARILNAFVSQAFPVSRTERAVGLLWHADASVAGLSCEDAVLVAGTAVGIGAAKVDRGPGTSTSPVPTVTAGTLAIILAADVGLEARAAVWFRRKGWEWSRQGLGRHDREGTAVAQPASPALTFAIPGAAVKEGVVGTASVNWLGKWDGNGSGRRDGSAETQVTTSAGALAVGDAVLGQREVGPASGEYRSGKRHRNGDRNWKGLGNRDKHPASA